MNGIFWKIGLLVTIVGLGLAFEAWLTTAERPQVMEAALAQLNSDGGDTVRIEQMHQTRSLRRLAIAVVVALAALELIFIDLGSWLSSAASKWVSVTRARATTALCLLAVLPLTAGCWRPFEPIELQTISPNEEAFLLPLTEDVKRQTSTNNEEYLKQNLVYTKQVRIPQQWVQKGYEYLGPNGKWQAAAILVKVDKSPVTREWTADPNSGTSNKNEAIWVMTSDQVEFSTGWTCTARIASRDDAVRFLHNYPNGALKDVLDTEVRGKLQATFGLEVTDQPMTKLRQEATPHILRTTREVIDFFKDRGVTITNLGITGGFIYKDKSIMDTMVRVFNAEQEKAIATAGFQAQEETNKAVFAEAEGRAKALIMSKQAEADSIKLVADAKSYEIDKAKQDSEMYVTLKRLEIERDKLQKWDGRFPTYFLGTAKTPDMLLQMPAASE
jgi:regulator of protease activity HflC (stomatin/prohibitin superfamily)